MKLSKIWETAPLRAMAEYTEKECSKAVRLILDPLCDDSYSHESGVLWNSNGNPRSGGTRTTPGFPDLTFYMHMPVYVTLTVESKGSGTSIRAVQWEYALHRMQRGDPHLIVRSPEALLNGLRFLGLLAPAYMNAPPVTPDRRMLPENFAFLERMRLRMWQRLSADMPSYADVYRPQWCSRRGLVLPSDVPRLLAEDKLRRALRRANRRRG